MEKLVIVAISLILLTESLDRKHLTVLFISTMLINLPSVYLHLVI